MGLIDFHAHMAPTEEARDRLLAMMDRLSITQSGVVAGGLCTPQQISLQINTSTGCNVSARNQEILQLCGSDRRLLPFYFANPYEYCDDYLQGGQEYYGLKLGPAIHGVALTDKRNQALIFSAQSFGHPVYLHCLSQTGFDTDALLTLAKKFPLVNFVLGHAGIGNCDFFAVDHIRPYANIYFETSGGFSSVIKYAVDRLGIGRILFGSEYPLQEPSLEITKMEVLGLSLETLSQNASALLRLEQRHA